MKTKRNIIIVIIVLVCGLMSVVDAVIQPGYFIKSLIKITLFLLCPLIYSFYDKECNLKKLFIPDKKGILTALSLGVGVYAVVVGAYFAFRGIFDFSALTSSLTSTTGVNKNNFIFVAVYISFANSLLEEFFFRGFAFLTLKGVSNRVLAYVVSSTFFAVYHIAMMIGWFAWPVILLSMIGLFVGGVIFDFMNEKYNNIYLSWLIHMFANFATNTIGFILFSI
ncbi:MAG: CPBP family intramembrane metalloprotease [Clostridia bacterium]|nr:CPBP family intramembrane metalloprotease [Clostridia bacterium]